MPQAVEPTFMAGITAEPLLVVKEQPQQQARNKAEENPDPGHNQVELGCWHFHGAKLKDCCAGVVIDKKCAVIGEINVMNVHHLELFYYVAKHGGISEAVRNMPYGIQQPAVSGQVIQLEEFLGVTLFQRRPFVLTTAGKELYEYARPFFDNLTPMAEKIRGGVSQHLRIAASETVLRTFLPGMLQALRQSYPKLKVTLREGYHPQVLAWLDSQEIDMSIGLIGGKPSSPIQAKPLFDLPLALLVPRDSNLNSAAELWQRDRIEESLITVPSNEPMRRAFHEGLARHKVDWLAGIEVSSVEMV